MCHYPLPIRILERAYRSISYYTKISSIYLSAADIPKYSYTQEKAICTKEIDYGYVGYPQLFSDHHLHISKFYKLRYLKNMRGHQQVELIHSTMILLTKMIYMQQESFHCCKVNTSSKPFFKKKKLTHQVYLIFFCCITF